eukprot:gene12045-biopygen6430
MRPQSDLPEPVFDCGSEPGIAVDRNLGLPPRRRIERSSSVSPAVTLGLSPTRGKRSAVQSGTVAWGTSNTVWMGVAVVRRATTSAFGEWGQGQDLVLGRRPGSRILSTAAPGPRVGRSLGSRRETSKIRDSEWPGTQDLHQKHKPCQGRGRVEEYYILGVTSAGTRVELGERGTAARGVVASGKTRLVEDEEYGRRMNAHEAPFRLDLLLGLGESDEHANPPQK